YRQHQSSISATTSKSGERLRCDIKVVESLFGKYRALIPDAKNLQRQARAALTVKALIYAGDAFTLGYRDAAISAVSQCLKLARRLIDEGALETLIQNLNQGEEYAVYESSKLILRQLHAYLEGTRYGEKIRKIAVANPEWEQTLRKISTIIKQLVPEDYALIAVDKYDPSLLHFSQRRGWHFPDRRLMPGGYPKDCEEAIEHLEQLRQFGALYIVFPNSSFWWLDYYKDFALHLNTHYRKLWDDELCVLYDLSRTNHKEDRKTAFEFVMDTVSK
ncbi:MAG: hypothetical protein M3362_05660, partial [Acidobacteriota bacterium]|nr:hypothetical protein [Acidobacteriota bacterium]